LLRQGVLRWLAPLLAAAAVGVHAQTPAAPRDPFAWLAPSVVVSADDRRVLDRGDPIAVVLPSDKHELAVFAAITVTVDAARLRAWVNRIELLKQSEYVLGIERLSDPPRLGDFANLVVDDDDLDAIRSCHAGDCALKMSAAEMAALQDSARAAGKAWRPAVQAGFREMVFARVQAYIASGVITPYEDKRPPIAPSERFAGILDHLPFLAAHAPGIAARLAAAPTPGAGDSFFYWSKERIARKAVVNVTEVHIFPPETPDGPALLVTARNVFATHYINGSLGVTALFEGAPGGPNYLIYVNRSSVDTPGGLFSGMVRWFAERRLKGNSGQVLRTLRTRLESGAPPG